jgi:hypothetical protein
MHIDDLKSFSIGEQFLRKSVINSDIVLEAADQYGHEIVINKSYKNFETLPNTLNGGNVWLGYPGLAQMDKVVQLVLEENYETLYVAVPMLPCYNWLQTLDQIDLANWFGIDRNDVNHPFWLSEDGSATLQPSITWYLVKFVPTH